jgi:hypothetical protein
MTRFKSLALGVLASLAMFGLAAQPGRDEVKTPVEHRRTADQTFLTFPEWYLVHSPAEYAAYLTGADAPSRFPLFSHIGQLWSSYAAVNGELERFPFNAGYHLMVMVIGVSTTVEYGIKGLYEHTVGRLAEATRSGESPVPEERFAASFAKAYVDFIRIEPWYLFDFGAQLKALWADVPGSGPNLLRRWERRFALTSELLAKEAYARFIKLGTQSIYDAPKPVTAVLLSAEPQPDPTGHPDYGSLAKVDEFGALATVPRYEAFTAYGRWLAAQGIDFREIAGNRGEIVVSLLVPAPWQAESQTTSRRLFVHAVLTRPGVQRVVLATPVNQLANLLRQIEREFGPGAIEHVYDF